MLLMLCFNTYQSAAQKNNVKFGYAHNRMIEQYMISVQSFPFSEIYNPQNHFWLLGFERTISNRVSLGVNVYLSHRLEEPGSIYKDSITSTSFYFISYNGSQKTRGYGIEYISKYYFSDFDDHAPDSKYIGLLLSNFYYDNEVKLTPNVNNTYNHPDWIGTFKRTTNITKLGFRLGWEKCIDHFLFEIYTGMDYNIVSNTDSRKAHPDYLNKYYPDLSFAWGINFGYHLY